MAGWVIPVVAALAVAGLIAYRLLMGKKKPGYLAIAEYWVYVDAEKLPSQEVLMDRMISSNPHNRPGKPCIGAREGLVFTDIRLHAGVAKREKNPHAFRPDLFREDVVPTPEILEILPDCRSFVTCRFMSEVPLKDTRHLQFLPHMADAVSDLMGGKVVFDAVLEKIWTSEEFTALLASNNNAERPDFHVRVIWRQESGSCYAVTKGLQKVGLSELRTEDQEADSEILVTGLLLRMAFALFRDPAATTDFRTKEYGDEFVLTRCEEKVGPYQVVKMQRIKGQA